MSLLLLFGAGGGRLGVAAALVTLSVPDATLTADNTTLTATPSILTLSAPAAESRFTVGAAAGLITFTAPPATLSVSGVATLAATPAILTFTTGTPQITIDLTVPVILIGGVTRTSAVDVDSLTITDELDEAPNTATLTVYGTAPLVGQEIAVSLGGLVDRVFAGHLVSVEQVYLGDRRENVAWQCTAVDYTRLLDRRMVNRQYDAQSATTMVASLMATFTAGFTVSHVVAGLPTVEALEFLWEPPTRALTRIAKLIGGSWYMDYNRDLHFFLVETVDAPADITEAAHAVQALAIIADLSQVRDRVIVTGGGSTTPVAMPSGTTIIPLDDATLFASGYAQSGTQRFAYTGKYAGGDATNVGSSIAAPGTAPTAALSSTTVGSIVGVVSYKVTLKNASGETLPSAASNAVTGVNFTAPGSGPTVAAISGLGALVGTYSYKLTNVTDRGETTPGPASSTVTANPFAAPTAPSINLGSGIGRLVGAYNYRQTFITAYGETDGGSIGNRTAVAISAPGAPSLSEVSSTVGVLIGSYTYGVSFVTPYGETLRGSTNAITVAAQTAPSAPGADVSNFPGPLIGVYSYKVAFVSNTGETIGSATSNITASILTANSPGVSGDGTGVSIAYAVTYVHPVYGESALSARTVDTNKGANPVVSVSGLPAGCGWNVYSTGVSANPSTDPMFKVAEMPVGASSFTHTTQTGPQEGVVPAMGRYGIVSSIPAGPTGTVARRVYRTKAGGSGYYLVGQIDNNTAGVSFTDVTPDGALTVTAPVSNLNGKQVALTSIPTGPTGTLGRRLWRTKAGGSAYFLIGQLDNNSTTTFTDNTPNDALTQSAPLVATAGGDVHNIGLVTGPTGTIGRRLWRTEAGGATYRLLAEIPDNTTATFVDNVADTQLGGDTVPVTNTAGGQNIQLTGIPTGPTGTLARRLWRTKAGGSEYFFVGQISDNTTSTFVDSTTDSSLRTAVPLVNDAGASAVNVTIPTGPAGITSRRLYRTEGGGSAFRFVAEVRDNTTTTFLDTKADTALGDLAPDVATIGALAASSSLAVVNASAFPAAGWAEVDSQRIQWTSRTSTLLSGIPSSGDGSLKSAVSAGSSIVALPLLTGVTGLTVALAEGDAVNILVERNDTGAQAALAALEGGDGIHEFFIHDESLTIAAAIDRGDAELALFATAERTLTFACRDSNVRSGKSITVNLGPPTNISGTFKIQRVVLSQFGLPHLLPLRQVTASSYFYTLDHLLRRVELGA